MVTGSAAAQQNGPTAVLSRGLESRELRYPALLCRVPTVDPDILPANGFQSLMKAFLPGQGLSSVRQERGEVEEPRAGRLFMQLRNAGWLN